MYRNIYILLNTPDRAMAKTEFSKMTANVKTATFRKFRDVVLASGQKIGLTLEILMTEFLQGVEDGSIVLFGKQKKGGGSKS